MTNNCYISADNIKAHSHFLKRGYALVKGKHITRLAYLCAIMVDDDATTDDIKADDVYYVDGFPTGAAFHRYMVANGLLLNPNAKAVKLPPLW